MAASSSGWPSKPTWEDGVFFVELVPIRDPVLIISTIAQALGVRDEGERPLLDSLKERLRARRLLLVLDNFEQVVAAAPLVAELLANSPKVKVLATSREALHLSEEYEFPLSLLWMFPTLDTCLKSSLYPSTRRYNSSSSEPKRLSRIFPSRTRTRRQWPKSVTVLTGYRWPLNWQRRASSCSRLKQYWHVWRAGSSC